MNEVFEGQVSHVRIFPFAMYAWERRIYYQHFPVAHFAANSLDLSDGASVSEWKDTSADLNDYFLPKWFRVWLWLRTKWAEFKRWVE